jgi:hypothetical protein
MMISDTGEGEESDEVVSAPFVVREFTVTGTVIGELPAVRVCPPMVPCATGSFDRGTAEVINEPFAAREYTMLEIVIAGPPTLKV